MQGEQPSVTAIGAAAYRAAHQKSENGNILFDPFARTILGEEASLVADSVAYDPTSRAQRLFVAARSRFAEDAISNAVGRGVSQVVVLGAGLDTFSLRNPYVAAGVRVFEVDHPATQAWKRERIALAGLTVGPLVAFVGVDFQRQSLAECLAIRGFDSTVSAFFTWLGVVPYLDRPEITAILRFISEIPGAEVVFDYIEPIENYPAEQRALVTAWHESMAACGEPWLSHFNPIELARELRDLGFAEIEDIDWPAMGLRYLATPTEKGGGAHVIRAKLPSRSEDAIAAYDDVLSRFATATELPLRELVANAIVNKGVTLSALDRSEDAIAAYDNLLARFNEATGLPLRELELVAKALFNKGVTLGALGRSEDAIAAYDDLVACFGAATGSPLRELVANAVFNKGVTLGALGRGEDAIAAYDDLRARFASAIELPLRELVANALVNKDLIHKTGRSTATQRKA
jgi:methyltransferase (TIGR00027 family)